jgi:hypothetical protein
MVGHETRFAAEGRCRYEQRDHDLADHVLGPAFERVEPFAHSKQRFDDPRMLGPRQPRLAEAFLQPLDHKLGELLLPPLFAAQPGVLT